MSWIVLHIFKDVARWHYFFSSRRICIDIIWTQWCAERCLRQNGNDIAISSWWCWRQMDFFFCSFKKIYKNVPKLLQSKEACVINYSSRFQNQQEGRNSSSTHTRGEPSCNPPVLRKQQNIFIHWEYHKKKKKDEQQTSKQKLKSISSTCYRGIFMQRLWKWWPWCIHTRLNAQEYTKAHSHAHLQQWDL